MVAVFVHDVAQRARLVNGLEGDLRAVVPVDTRCQGADIAEPGIGEIYAVRCTEGP